MNDLQRELTALQPAKEPQDRMADASEGSKLAIIHEDTVLSEKSKTCK